MSCTRRELLASLSGAAVTSVFANTCAGKGNADRQVARILFNENPLGPSPLATAAISQASDELSRYPLGKGRELEQLIRRKCGLPFTTGRDTGLSLQATVAEGTHDLLIGVGSSEILKAAAWAYGSIDGTIVEAYPGYAAVGKDAEGIPNSKIQRKLVPLSADHKIDSSAMVKAIDDSTRIVVICNPNNPTGTMIPLSEIESVIDVAPDDALVVVDEAYIEFLGAEASKASAVQLALRRKNVLVTRTFSKIYGLAGLRVGYGIASKEVAGRLKAHMLGGLGLSMAGVVGAIAAMEDAEHLAKTIQLRHTIHDAWSRAFSEVGWRMVPSKASFCWVDVGSDCSALVQFLMKRGVLISGGQRWNLPNYVRVSVGTLEENERFIGGVKAFVNA